MIVLDKLPTLCFVNKEPQEFVELWSEFYAYSEDYLYAERIDKNQLDVDDIEKLFEWKNGGNLSQKKGISLREKIINKMVVINRLKSDFHLDHFKREFAQVSAIWKIFLLHVIAPQEYPIFDQHVYRAFHFLENNEISAIPYDNKKKEEIYFDQYVDFFKSFSERITSSHKKLDEALWAFGKFLKTAYGKTLVKKTVVA